jgi:hypothetical protein
MFTSVSLGLPLIWRFMISVEPKLAFKIGHFCNHRAIINHSSLGAKSFRFRRLVI